MSDSAGRKLTNLSVIRVLCALFVFLYHAYHNMGCRYGVLDPIVSQSAFFMTAFFLLSGFVLFYGYSGRELLTKDALGRFYSRRIARLYPLYFLVWFVFFFLETPAPVARDLFTFPFQALLLQNAPGFYPYLMNAGTWFFSCILICYLAAPFAIYVVCSLTRRESAIALAVTLSLLGCAPLLNVFYGVVVYHSPAIRLLEFFFGMLLCRLFSDREQLAHAPASRAPGILASLLLLLGLALVRVLRTRLLLFSAYPDCAAPLGALFVGASVVLYARSVPLFWRRVRSALDFLGQYSLEFWVASFFSTYLYYVSYHSFLGPWIESLSHPNRMAVLLTLLLNLAVTAVLAVYVAAVKKLSARFRPKRLFLAALGCMLLLIALKLIRTYL